MQYDSSQDIEAELGSDSASGEARDTSARVGKVAATSHLMPYVPRGGDAEAAVGVAASGSGRPLDASIRDRFESCLGTDLCGVQIHTGAPSAQAAAAVGARAYALGQDIHFADGEYRPGDPAGLHLLAHEVAHTVQQRGGSPLRQHKLEVSSPSDAAEQEADRAADAIVAGERFAIGGAGAGVLHRSAAAPSWPPAPTPRDPRDKTEAQSALLDWHARSLGFVDANRQWLSANWIAYLRRTSKNPRLGWTEGVAGATLSNALGNVISGPIGEELIKGAAKRSASAIGAAIGTAVEPGAGTAIGFVLGVLVEQAASMVFEAVTNKSDTDDAASAANLRLGDLILDQTGALDAASTAAFGELGQLFARGQTILTATTDPAIIERIRAWAVEESAAIPVAAPRADRSLYQRMLAEWVLEHAGDEEDAASDTSAAQWEGARDEAFGAGDLDGHPEIFAYQTRSQWSKAGLDPSPAQEMIDRVAALQGDPGARANAAVAAFQGRRVAVRVVDRERFTAYAVAAGVAFEGSSEAKALRAGRFTLSCTLDLSVADHACYIDEWEYTLAYTHAEDVGTWNNQRGTFAVSPD